MVQYLRIRILKFPLIKGGIPPKSVMLSGSEWFGATDRIEFQT